MSDEKTQHPEPLEVGFYSATDAFRAIHQHVAVMRPDLSLVAVCGPSTGPGAMEAIAVAHRFAASEELLAALRGALPALTMDLEELTGMVADWPEDPNGPPAVAAAKTRLDAAHAAIARAEATR